jgi:putative peptidoglycan lipid II flippase
MLGRIFTVGGFTLVSRVSGFARDIMLAAILGAGPIADAFFVALRLPNHFRAIFAEGAFNAAFVPAYARIRTQDGPDAAKLFGDRIFTLMVVVQVVLLAIALVFTPQVISVLAPGFNADPGRFALDRSHPHHISLSAAGVAGHALWRHPELDPSFRDTGRGADPA